MKGQPIIVERLLNAPPEKAWKAITETEGMKRWGFEIAEFKPVVGFEFRFLGGKDEKKYLHVCKVTDVVPGKNLAYSPRASESLYWNVFSPLICFRNYPLASLPERGELFHPGDLAPGLSCD